MRQGNPLAEGHQAMLVDPAHRIAPPHGKAEQAAVKPRSLLPKAAAEHLHRRGLRQGLPQGQGTLGQQKALYRSSRGSGGTAPLGQGQLLQQVPLLGSFEFPAGGDGGLEHQQALGGGGRCRRRRRGWRQRQGAQGRTAGRQHQGGARRRSRQLPIDLPIQLGGHAGHGRQAEQMGTQHHQARQSQPAPTGAAAAQQAPQAPAHQHLQRRHQTGAAQGGNPGQGRVAGEGGTAQPDPEEGAASEQHLRQPPETGGGNRRGRLRRIPPAHEAQPALHQQPPRQAAGTPQRQTERQAQGSRHPDPVEGMEPEQPAVADQHRRGPPEQPAPTSPLRGSGGRRITGQGPERRQADPDQRRKPQRGQSQTGQASRRHGQKALAPAGPARGRVTVISHGKGA